MSPAVDVKKREQVVLPTILPNCLILLIFPPDGVVSADGDSLSSHANLPEERPLTGVEQMFLLQGLPIHDTNLSNVLNHHSVLRDSSGNMSTGTKFLIMMLAVLFSVEWSKPVTDAAGDAADNATADAAIEAAVTHAAKAAAHVNADNRQFSDDNQDPGQQIDDLCG